jgi:hypothetical protein
MHFTLSTMHEIMGADSWLLAGLSWAIGLVMPLLRSARTITFKKGAARCVLLFIAGSAMTCGCKSFDCLTCPDSKNNSAPTLNVYADSRTGQPDQPVPPVR